MFVRGLQFQGLTPQSCWDAITINAAIHALRLRLIDQSDFTRLKKFKLRSSTSWYSSLLNHSSSLDNLPDLRSLFCDSNCNWLWIEYKSLHAWMSLPRKWRRLKKASAYSFLRMRNRGDSGQRKARNSRIMEGIAADPKITLQFSSAIKTQTKPTNIPLEIDIV